MPQNKGLMQILFFKTKEGQEDELQNIIELSHLRKDGTLFKWVNDDIMTWISDPSRYVKMCRIED